MDKEKYKKWMKDLFRTVRNKELEENVWRYRVTETGEKVCENFSRNSIINWKAGRSLPQNKETLLSIALFEYDEKHCKEAKDPQWRQARYDYAREKLLEIKGIKLYERDIHDALLVLVCRGIISFQEVIELEEELYQELHNYVKENRPKDQENRKVALDSHTTLIESELYQVDTKEEIKEIFRKFIVAFHTSNLTLGERTRRLYNKRSNRYAQKMPLVAAVDIFAPNYRGTYSRKILSPGTTREWLLDFGIHLRLNREELETVLKDAHMSKLSEESSSIERFYKEADSFEIGSAGWYQRQAEQKDFPGHFAELPERSLLEKMGILLLLTIYMKYFENCFDTRSMKELPPIDYLLEPFCVYEQGNKALEKVLILLENAEEEADYFEMQGQIEEQISGWLEYVDKGYECARKRNLLKVFDDYRMECRAYYEMDSNKLKMVKNKEEAGKIHYLAALFYTVLTGKYYTGGFAPSELEDVKKQFEALSDQPEELLFNRSCYYFLSNVLGTFLGNKPLFEGKAGSFYFENENERWRLSKDIILEYLWEITVHLEQCTK